MDDPEYALTVFRSHLARARVTSCVGLSMMELGPGDSLASAVIAAAHGAGSTQLVDVGRFASSELRVYRRLHAYLCTHGLELPALELVHDIPSLLDVCRARYETSGLDSLRKLAPASVDFIWSHAVLEHVRRGQFEEMMKETRRVLRTGGVCSHQIDLRDHLGGALNNLRIPSKWWEADWMALSGFYTNRLSISEMIEVFCNAGFVVESLAADRWKAPPISRRSLAWEFQERTTQDLLVRTFAVTLRAI